MPAGYCSVSYRSEREGSGASSLLSAPGLWHLSATHLRTQVAEANSQTVSSLMDFRWLAHISGKPSKNEAGILAMLLPLATFPLASESELNPAGQIVPNSGPESRGKNPFLHRISPERLLHLSRFQYQPLLSQEPAVNFPTSDLSI